MCIRVVNSIPLYIQATLNTQNKYTHSITCQLENCAFVSVYKIWSLVINLNWMHLFHKFRCTYLTSASDRASIQYTFDFFLREPNAISCDMWQPSGSGGRFGIWPVHWAIANISGASFTNTFPAGADRPGSWILNHTRTNQHH